MSPTVHIDARDTLPTDVRVTTLLWGTVAVAIGDVEAELSTETARELALMLTETLDAAEAGAL